MPLDYIPLDSVPLPPKDANVHTTACDYCVVGCGYKVYTWPVGQEGGPKPEENALGAGFPGNVLPQEAWARYRQIVDGRS